MEATKTSQQMERERGIYERLLIPNFGKIPLNKITVDQVEAFQARRKDEGRAASTINKEVQLLKNMAKKAVEWGKIRSYQFASVKPFREPPGRVRWLEGDQYLKLIDHMPSWLTPIVILAAFTGMRRGEVCGLRKGNIDRNRRQFILEETKNRERRVIPMNQTVCDIITSLPPRIDTSYLFADDSGQPISKANVSIAFKRACKKAGIENFRFHDLRHHFASRLTMDGRSQRVIMALLGHKDPKMTIRYQHLSPEYLREAVESLDEKAASGES